MDGAAEGKPVPQALHDRGIVPFLKIDKGLEAEADGVQLMKPIPGLDALLQRAKELGVFGTKERSVVNLANRDGIARIVAQQFQIADQVAAHGMMPIIEPEVNIKSSERADADRSLVAELEAALNRDRDGPQVMLKLSLPAERGIYEPLIHHPRVLRVVALSGGFDRGEACAELARNKGMIASFSRALLEDLRHGMSDAEFDAALKEAIDQIYAASVEKTPDAL
jgi:fructose-bisphosphate aldolase class I